jgi:hypothetical protein
MEFYFLNAIDSFIPKVVLDPFSGTQISYLAASWFFVRKNQSNLYSRTSLPITEAKPFSAFYPIPSELRGFPYFLVGWELFLSLCELRELLLKSYWVVLSLAGAVWCLRGDLKGTSASLQSPLLLCVFPVNSGCMGVLCLPGLSTLEELQAPYAAWKLNFPATLPRWKQNWPTYRQQDLNVRDRDREWPWSYWQVSVGQKQGVGE